MNGGVGDCHRGRTKAGLEVIVATERITDFGLVCQRTTQLVEAVACIGDPLAGLVVCTLHVRQMRDGCQQDRSRDNRPGAPAHGGEGGEREASGVWSSEHSLESVESRVPRGGAAGEEDGRERRHRRGKSE